MGKICLGCKRAYGNEVWLHEELGICSICYNVHVHSKVQEWDNKIKMWVKKEKKRGIERWV